MKGNEVMNDLWKMACDNWQVLATLATCAVLVVGYRLVRKAIDRGRVAGKWLMWTIFGIVFLAVIVYCFSWWLGPVYGANDEVEITRLQSELNGKIGVVRDWKLEMAHYSYFVECGGAKHKFLFAEIRSLGGPYIPGIPSFIIFILGSFLVIVRDKLD
ncbi:hypothetical protein HN997_05555 [archaeon]|jgi:hypothetical protein|nr:hypothetical protein [archaeon]MBT7239302.1 hypothetical protein [archaeon]MBT7915431.1 hypothetical protein [Candidatus Bathyarchaeota archaeon]